MSAGTVEKSLCATSSAGAGPQSGRPARTLLMIANCFPPQNISGAKRPYRFAKCLPAYGYEPQVISASGDLPGWKEVHSTPDGTEERHVRAVSRYFEAIQRHLLPYNDSLPWIPYAVSTGVKYLSRNRDAVVFSTSPPIASHLAAWEIKRRCGVKWVADFRDPLLGNPFRTRKGAWLYDGAIERLIFRFADAVIANTDVMAEGWRRRYPRWAAKIHLIWNGYDPEETVEAKNIPLRPFRVLAHVGSLYGGRVPTRMLASLERLIASRKIDSAAIRLQLIGKLEPRDLLARDPHFASLSQQIHIESSGETVPESDARQAMAQADYLFLLDNNSKGLGIQVPAKLFDYIRIGRPILAVTTPDSPAHRILSRSGISHRCIFPQSSDREIDEALGTFLQMSHTARRPSEWFWRTFNGVQQAGQLASILDGLFSTAK